MTLDSTLARITLRMASTLDVRDVLAEITRGLVDDFGVALARIWLLEPDDPKTLRLVASAGLSTRLDGAHARVPVGELKIGQIAETRTALSSTDLAGDPRFPEKKWIADNALEAFAGYPLVYRDELLGVLATFSRAKVADHLEVFAAQAAIALANAQLVRRLRAENVSLGEGLDRRIVGDSAALRSALEQVDRVAKAPSTVLLLGETGTGKELFARAIHEKSPRRRGPMVKVNCGALPPTLVESELFGHEKGAFTGAVARRIGRFELADGGTLFLDEISELPPDAQTKLLRVLQEREIERVGGTKPVRIDVRIIAATNRDLAAEVREGRFRDDLYFRLAVFPIRIPPLRERREDIPALVESIVRRFGRTIDEDVVPYLQAYEWPGNVRELENVLERAAVLARDSIIHVSDLPELSTTTPAEEASLKERVNAYERSIIEEALKRAGGNQSEAARLLATSRATLQYRMKTLGL